MNKLIILVILVISIALSGCTDSPELKITTRYDIIEYDIGNQYFVYLDGDNIKQISWDATGWNSMESTVNIKQSDELYVEKIISQRYPNYAPAYILYLNVSIKNDSVTPSHAVNGSEGDQVGNNSEEVQESSV